MPSRRPPPSEDTSDSYDEADDDGSSDFVDELSADEIPGEIESANCRVMSTRELFQQMTNKWVPTLLFSERLVAIETVDKDGRAKPHSTKKKRIWVFNWQPGKQWYFKQSNPPSPSRLIISDELQEIFLSRGITTALYQKLSEVQERDIFRLVQEGKPLTIGEKMQAAAGPWGEYFEDLTQTYMVRDAKHPNGWCPRIVKMSRGADFKTITAMVLLIRDMIRHPDVPPGLLTSAQLQKELIALQDVPVPLKLKKEVTMLLDMFMNISLLAPPSTPYTTELTTPEAIFAPIKQGRKSMISPVEMIWIPYLISRHGRQLSIVRIKYPSEVKNNKEVTRFIVNWITTVDLRRLKGKYSGFRVPRMPDVRRVESSSSSAPSQTQPSFNRTERPDTKTTRNGINSPTSPQSSTQTKKRIGTPNDSDPGSITISKRPRHSAPYASSNLAQSSTPQSRLDPAIASGSAPVASNASSTRLTANGTSGANLTNGIDRPHADVVGPFGNKAQPRSDANRAGQLPSFGGSSNQQFGQSSSFASRVGSMSAYSSSQPTHGMRNVDFPRPSSYATAQPF